MADSADRRRIWQEREKDHGAVHALGNGRLLVYACGPDLIQFVGPPYSSPSLGAVQFVQQPGTLVASSRRSPAAIWDHTLEQDGTTLASWSDTVDPEWPVYARRVSSSVPMELELVLPDGVTFIHDRARMTASGWDDGCILVLRHGLILLDLPSTTRVHGQMAFRGPVRMAPPPTEKDRWRILFEPGESELILATGESLASCQEASLAAIRLGAEAILTRSTGHWKKFAARRAPIADVPGLREAADDVAVLIATQQGKEGGVLAGHRYHTDYLRDAYGVGRGLLALGHHSEAQAIVDYYRNTFDRTGMLGNSQTVGGMPQFQRNEHDDAEGAALVILQIFDLAKALGDQDLPRRYLPLVDWCWRSMTALLTDDMLPFSGDETYMAGRLLSRDVIEHGSAEGTMLFIRAGERLLPWVRHRDLWQRAAIDAAEQALRRCREAYRGHFIRDGRLIANQPSREASWAPTPARRGFCQDCWSRRAWTPLTYGIHVRSEHGRYLCPSCIARADRLPSAVVPPQTLPSVSLVAPYLGSDLIGPGELRPAVDELLPALCGKVSDVPRLVGYDAGLLLFSLNALHHPAASTAATALLGLRDQTGAWVEYYNSGIPTGCRARPWESGVNIAALIAHFNSAEK